MEEEIRKCVQVLRKGGTLLSPTDTIWGIGCDATNPDAVDRIFRLKRRMENKSMIILLTGADKLEHYVTHVPGIAYDLMNSVERPLTIIYPGARRLAPKVIGGDGSVAIRIVKSGFIRTLCHAFGKPLVSTSANLSGEPAPLLYHGIAPAILSGVDHAVPESFDELHDMKPSRIVRLHLNGEFEVIRP